VGDVVCRLNERQLAQLCALADGSLREEAGRVEAAVAASPEMRALLQRQRRAVAATRALAARDPVPASLRAAVEGHRRPQVQRRPRPSVRLRLAIAGAVATAAVAAVELGPGPGAPSVADAARIAARPPTGPAPRPVGGGAAQLGVGIQGVRFPNLATPYGWRAVGVRRDRVDGRDVTVVYYAKADRRIAYIIVSGSSLPRPPGGLGAVRGGVAYEALRLDGVPAVTWRRSGHTCLVVGRVPLADLLALASRPG
jgi:anti-sigma factor RsiW